MLVFNLLIRGAPTPVGAPGHLHHLPRATLRSWRKAHVDEFIRDARALISAEVREASVCLFVCARLGGVFRAAKTVAGFLNLPPKINAASLPSFPPFLPPPREGGN